MTLKKKKKKERNKEKKKKKIHRNVNLITGSYNNFTTTLYALNEQYIN